MSLPLTTPVEFQGVHAALLPLEKSHAEGLAQAVRDGELWNLHVTRIPRPEEMAAEIERRLALQAQGKMLPFCVLDAQRRPMGMTTYMNIDHENRRVEIGSTWYAKSVQRTGLNTECKLFLLTHAFERLECLAVELRTHRLNTASRRAIERLGAKLDGILRSHMRMGDGSLRDTAVYSITAEEWPAVKDHLQYELTRTR